MNSKAPQMQRRFMVPFRCEGDQAFSLLLLNASNYEDALKIARCVGGEKADRFLCYKDFLVYD